MVKILPSSPFGKANLAADGISAAAAFSAGATAQRGARAAGGVQAVSAASKAVPLASNDYLDVPGKVDVRINGERINGLFHLYLSMEETLG